MDANDIAKLVQDIKISQAKDTIPVVLSPDLALLGQHRLESCLIGKIFSAKAVNRETFRSHMPRILQTKKDITIEMVGDNLFLLDFNSIADKKRALLDGPWNFFKEMVIFEKPRGLQNPAELSFSEVPLWVQLHNLPIAFMQPNILRSLGAQLGQVLEVETDDRGLCAGKYARIRILKNIMDPLLKGLCVRIPNSTDEACIIFIYEKLPNFCYGCGRLGHLSRDCEDGSIDQNTLSFGNWMRATSSSVNRRPGNSRNRISESSVPFNRSEDSESPSDFEAGKYSRLLEHKSLKPDTSGSQVIGEEELEKDPIQLDICSNTHDLMGLVESFMTEEGIDGVESIKKTEFEKQLIDISKTSLLAKDKGLMIVEPALPSKGKKQWKRLARGVLDDNKEQETVVVTACGGKRSSEPLVHSAADNKKLKHTSGSISLSTDKSAVAVVQPRRTL